MIPTLVLALAALLALLTLCLMFGGPGRLRLPRSPRAFLAHLWSVDWPATLALRIRYGEAGGLNLAAADAVLKEDYKGPVVEQLNNSSLVAAQIDTNTEDVRGRRFYMALHVGRNSGVGARGEQGDLPTAGSQRYDNVVGPVRYNYARIELTVPVISAMTKDRGSFIRALKPEMKGATDDAARDFARQVWGTSDGKICGVNTVNSATLTPPGIRQDQLMHLEEGFLVDVGTTADPDSIAAGLSVVSVDYDAGTVTLSASVNVTAGTHFISRAGAGGTTDNSGTPDDGQIELTGLQTIVDDTATLHTLSPSTESRWKALVYGNGGTPRAISENLVNRANMRTETISGGMVDLVVCSGGVWRAYTDLLTSLRRFMDTSELKGGYGGTKIGAPRSGPGGKSQTQTLAWDRDCPDFTMWGLDSSTLQMMEQDDWQWMDDDGSVLSRVSGKAAYEATLYAYKELTCDRRNANWKIEDLIEA